MSTAMNCTVNTYKGVPLLKGGTEVLYESQGTAVGALASFLHKTYSLYYYSRENRGAIQVEDVIQNVEGINYIAFQNISHGGKWFFGFVDQIVYINDNNTEIQFTIDPFPTYMGDGHELSEVYIIRNTPKVDSEFLLAPDFENCGRAFTYTEKDKIELTLSKILCVFTPGRLQEWDDQGTVIADVDSISIGSALNQYGQNTGIKYLENPTQNDIRQINQSGGTIIGIYAVDGNFNPTTLASTETLSYTVTDLGLNHKKLTWSDQYNKLFVVGAGQSKEYNIQKFLSPQSTVVFRLKRYMNPIPTLCIYPEDYEGSGVATNEAIVIQYPTLASAVSNGDVAQGIAGIGNLMYNRMGAANYQETGGWSKAETMIEEAEQLSEQGKGLAGFFKKLGGNILYDATSAVQGARGMINTIASLGTAIKSIKSAEITTSAGGLVLTTGNKILFRLVHCRPNLADLQAIDKYMDYFGYNFNEVRVPNTDDKAYLQTGQPFIFGTEKDLLLNSYFMSGIKIRRTLTNPPVSH